MPGLHRRKMTLFKGLSVRKSFVTTGAGFQRCAKYPSPPWVCLGRLAKTTRIKRAGSLDYLDHSMNQDLLHLQ